jgi:osmotically-inducible protein OsmY
MNKQCNFLLFIALVSFSPLLAEQTEPSINEKASKIISDAKVKANELILEAQERANAIVEKAKKDAQFLKEESLASIDESSNETKQLAKEVLEKIENEGDSLLEKSKSSSEILKKGMEDKYVYAKDVLSESYSKTQMKVHDTVIHAVIKYAYFKSPEINSMKIDIDVKEGIVELLGKVKSEEEANTAIKIALNTDGVLQVKALFLIQNK